MTLLSVTSRPVKDGTNFRFLEMECSSSATQGGHETKAALSCLVSIMYSHTVTAKLETVDESHQAQFLDCRL